MIPRDQDRLAEVAAFAELVDALGEAVDVDEFVEDAAGHEHSAKDGKFVSKGQGGAAKAKVATTGSHNIGNPNTKKQPEGAKGKTIRSLTKELLGGVQSRFHKDIEDKYQALRRQYPDRQKFEDAVRRELANDRGWLAMATRQDQHAPHGRTDIEKVKQRMQAWGYMMARRRQDEAMGIKTESLPPAVHTPSGAPPRSPSTSPSEQLRRSAIEESREPAEEEDPTPSKKWGASKDEQSKLRSVLAESPVKTKRNIGGGDTHSNPVYKVTLKDGTKAAFKPGSEELTNLSDPEPLRGDDVPAGTQYKREAAFSEVANILGFEDLAPQTTIRTIDGEEGSLQAWTEGQEAGSTYGSAYDGDKDAARAAVLDYITGHMDRHKANWMVENNGQMHLIDNGLSFPESGRAESFQNCRFWQRAINHGYEVPDLSSVKGKWPEVEKALKKYVGPKAIALTKERFDAAIENKGKQFAYLPSPAKRGGTTSLENLVNAVGRGGPGAE